VPGVAACWGPKCSMPCPPAWCCAAGACRGEGVGRRLSRGAGGDRCVGDGRGDCWLVHMGTLSGLSREGCPLLPLLLLCIAGAGSTQCLQQVGASREQQQSLRVDVVLERCATSGATSVTVLPSLACVLVKTSLACVLAKTSLVCVLAKKSGTGR
jgi:hypothetical protein